MKKRGVSPVVATVLLIAVVFILAVIIFLWARGFVSEKVTKFDRSIELSCGDVNFEAVVFGDELDIVNRGNVPIYGINVKKVGRGEILVNEIADSTIGQGESDSFDIAGIASSGDELLVVPIILGESTGGKVTYTCPDQFGYPVIVT